MTQQKSRKEMGKSMNRKKNWKENKLVQEWNAFWKQEEGVGTIEIVLLLVVLIGLVIIFKAQITKLLENIFKEIESQSKEVY